MVRPHFRFFSDRVRLVVDFLLICPLSPSLPGFVNIWDGFNKKRLCHLHKYPTSISSLCFSKDGQYLAIASSFLYENYEVKEIPEDSIFIRKVSNQEVMPK